MMFAWFVFCWLLIVLLRFFCFYWIDGFGLFLLFWLFCCGCFAVFGFGIVGCLDIWLKRLCWFVYLYVYLFDLDGLLVYVVVVGLIVFGLVIVFVGLVDCFGWGCYVVYFVYFCLCLAIDWCCLILKLSLIVWWLYLRISFCFGLFGFRLINFVGCYWFCFNSWDWCLSGVVWLGWWFFCSGVGYACWLFWLLVLAWFMFAWCCLVFGYIGCFVMFVWVFLLGVCLLLLIDLLLGERVDLIYFMLV